MKPTRLGDISDSLPQALSTAAEMDSGKTDRNRGMAGRGTGTARTSAVPAASSEAVVLPSPADIQAAAGCLTGNAAATVPSGTAGTPRRRNIAAVAEGAETDSKVDDHTPAALSATEGLFFPYWYHLNKKKGNKQNINNFTAHITLYSPLS